jgi:hypothetical protein
MNELERVHHTSSSAQHNGSGQLPADETLEKSFDMPFIAYSFIFSSAYLEEYVALHYDSNCLHTIQ